MGSRAARLMTAAASGILCDAPTELGYLTGIQVRRARRITVSWPWPYGRGVSSRGTTLRALVFPYPYREGA